jgi:hypothetical protein
MEDILLRGRAGDLVQSFLRSIKEKPALFLAYLTGIVENRISEGVFLHEIQTVLQILEEKAWWLVVDDVPMADQVRGLSRITGTIGAAKDQIAHIYLRHLERAELRAAVLQRCLDEQAKGTVSEPVGEDDLTRRLQAQATAKRVDL